MNDERLVVGLPAGSLADPNRGGNLVKLLEDAGFSTQGYDRGGPSAFPFMAYMVGWDGRPQEFGSQLALGEVDVAIGGDDWILERVLEYRYAYNQEIALKKTLSLERGRVRLVIVIEREDGALSCEDWLKQLAKAKQIVTAVSEMPYIALDWYLAKLKELGLSAPRDFSIQKYRTPPRIDAGIVVYETWGKTEAKVKYGSVDFGLEITQSGSAIANYELRIVDEVMSSETGVWVNPRITDNAGKRELARMFLLNLYGAVFAEDKVLLMFNAKNDKAPAILEYLRTNRLFADEPTMNEGAGYTEFSIQLDVNSTTTPLAKVRYELANLGATGLDTIPLESSIPGIGVIDL